MSDAVRTIDDYVTRYAICYCNGDVEEAKKHAIVKAVIEEKMKAGDQNG